MWRNTCECFATSVYFSTSPLGCQVAIYLVVRNFVEEGLALPQHQLSYRFRWPKQERLIVIANFEDIRRESVGLFLSCPRHVLARQQCLGRCSPVGLRPAGVRLRNHRGCNRLAFFVELAMSLGERWAPVLSIRSTNSECVHENTGRD